MAESLAALIAWAGTEGAIYGGGVAAADAAAAGAAGTAAAGAGTAAAGTAASSIAAEEAATIAAYEAAGLGATAGGAEAGLLGSDAFGYGAGNTVTDSMVAPELTPFEKYLEAGKQGFKNVGKAYSKMPPGTSQLVSQGLLGGAGGPNAQTNVAPPRGGGGQTSPMPGAPQNQLPQVTPYAPTVGGGDDQEMKKRLAMLRQAGLLGV